MRRSGTSYGSTSSPDTAPVTAMTTTQTTGKPARYVRWGLLVILAVLASFVSGAGAYTAEEETNIRIYNDYSPSVVNIVSTTVSFDLLFNPVPSQGAGSGVVVDDEGHIVTNFHVVDGARSLDVTLFDGSRYRAEVVGLDPGDDLAVIKIDAPASRLHPVRLGDSSGLKVGQKVFAIGNPFGLEKTLTVGIVSSVGRTLRASNGKLISGVIQTDAAINPGNSGGPLLNTDGEMIGVNSAIFTPTGGNVGIGFAIPSNTVARVLPDLLDKGFVSRAWLGISAQKIAAEDAAILKLPSSGILVAEVYRDSPAHKAGIRGATATFRAGNLIYAAGGDLLTAINGRAIRSMDEFNQIMDTFKPGDVVRLTLVRDGRTIVMDVTLEEMPEGRG